MTVAINVDDPVDPLEVSMSARHVDLARSLIHRQVETGRSPTCVAIVLRHGRVVLAEAAGVQYPGGPPLGFDNIFPIASCGKPMTAATLMTLAEQGVVGINDQLTTYLPEFELDGCNDDVLVHHLLTHTAGWEDTFPNPTVVRLLATEFADRAAHNDFARELMFQSALQGEKLAPAGAIMRYSNASYECLAEIIRRATGTSFSEAVKERILEPAGMTNSEVICSDGLIPLHIDRDPDVPFGAHWPTGSMHSDDARASDNGAGSVHSSAVDLAAFAQMILDGGTARGNRILAPATVRAMSTNQIPGVPAEFGGARIPEASWGLGFAVTTERRFPYFTGGLVPVGTATHPGAGGSSYWIDFENDIVGVWLEVVTELTEFMEPLTTATHIFQDVVTAAVRS